MEERSPSGRPSTALTAVARLLATALSIAAPILRPAWFKLQRPIFVVGCSPRSTTRIADILACHADIAPWRLKRPLAIGGLATRGEPLAEAEIGMGGLSRLRMALRLFSLMLLRRQVVVTAAGLSQLERLDQIFPGCRVIHVVRDARPEILGQVLSGRKHGKPTAERDHKAAERELAVITERAQRWAEVAGRIQDQGSSRLGPERYAEIRIEEFRAHPDYQLSRLDAFCGLDPARRDRKAGSRLIPEGDEGWSDGVSPEAAEKIRAVAGEQLTRLGYRID
jgi:hypothetical protein